jgi:hypothetical protein
LRGGVVNNFDFNVAIGGHLNVGLIDLIGELVGISHFYSLSAGIPTRVLHNTLNLVIVQNPELLAKYLESRTCVGAHEYKVALFAPRPGWELGRVFVRVWANPDYEQHGCGMFFGSQGCSISNEVEARTGDLFIDVRYDTQQLVARGDR